MGGTAFAKYDMISKRMNVEEFKQLKSEIYNVLEQINIEYLDIPYIKDKDTFGDIDILIVENEECTTIKTIYENLDKFGLTINEIIRNGDYVSIMYKGSQVDLIKTQPEYKYYHQSYLSHNDLGNLLGRTIKEAGFKHGHDGLFYTYRIGDKFKKEILLSRDHDVTLKILGLDPQKFKDGFDTLTDMFDFVISSPYFKPSRYQLSALNNRNRVRDRKRKNYNAFLKYIEGMQNSVLKVPSPFDLFDHLQGEVDKIVDKHEKKIKLRSKFNGNLCMKLTDLRGEDLGKFIGKITEKYKDILDKTDDEIKEIILFERSLYIPLT